MDTEMPSKHTAEQIVDALIMWRIQKTHKMPLETLASVGADYQEKLKADVEDYWELQAKVQGLDESFYLECKYLKEDKQLKVSVVPRATS